MAEQLRVPVTLAEDLVWCLSVILALIRWTYYVKEFKVTLSCKGVQDQPGLYDNTLRKSQILTILNLLSLGPVCMCLCA